MGASVHHGSNPRPPRTAQPHGPVIVIEQSCTGQKPTPDRVSKGGSLSHLCSLPLRPPGVAREPSNGWTAT